MWLSRAMLLWPRRPRGIECSPWGKKIMTEVLVVRATAIAESLRRRARGQQLFSKRARQVLTFAIGVAFVSAVLAAVGVMLGIVQIAKGDHATDAILKELNELRLREDTQSERIGELRSALEQLRISGQLQPRSFATLVPRDTQSSGVDRQPNLRVKTAGDRGIDFIVRAVSMRLRQPDSAFRVATPRSRRARSSDPEGSRMARRSPQAAGCPA